MNFKDALKCYIVSDDASDSISVDEFIPAAGYIKDGKSTDFMYDSFIFLPQPNYLYDHSPGGTGQRKPLKQSKWIEFIEEEAFMKGKNIDALDEAVGRIKKELNRPEYKAGVFLSLFYPHILVNEFGEVDGRMLNLSIMDDRKAALKWMVDKWIFEFHKRDYKNIEIRGFYWFAENIVPNDENEVFLPYMTDYIRSLGYITLWSLWFKAWGYESWKELGFDAVGYQPNFFPPHKSSWPNCGGEERLSLVSQTVDELGVGVEIEMGDCHIDSAKYVNKYYQEGRRAGWINTHHLYYMSKGPKLLKEISESDEPIIRESYDNTYHFIKNDL